MQVPELARGVWTLRRENVIMPEACLRHDALGPGGTGKTRIAPGPGLAACRKGQVGRLHYRHRAVTEARDERRLLRPQKQLAAVKLPSSGLRGPTGATVPPPHRRVGLRPALQDRRRTAVRDDLAAPQARRHPE